MYLLLVCALMRPLSGEEAFWPARFMTQFLFLCYNLCLCGVYRLEEEGGQFFFFPVLGSRKTHCHPACIKILPALFLWNSLCLLRNMLNIIYIYVLVVLGFELSL
jgi:hypothetical protein